MPQSQHILPILLASIFMAGSSDKAFGQPDSAGEQKSMLLPQTVAKESDFSLRPPSPGELFRPESEATARQRIRDFAKERKIEKIEFPPDAVVPIEKRVSVFPPSSAVCVPSIICFQPLYFEDRPLERYGMDFGYLGMVRHTAKFYVDAIILPLRVLHSPPCGRQCADHGVCPEVVTVQRCGLLNCCTWKSSAAFGHD